MREFTTALKEVVEENEDDALHFSVDGHELTAYPPSDGQIALIMASTGRHTNLQTRVAGLVDFFVEVMDEDSHVYLVGRLLDRKDPFGVAEVTDILEWMIEEWTGRPTKSLSVSTPSRRNGGRKSTQRTSKSTFSDSPATGS